MFSQERQTNKAGWYPTNIKQCVDVQRGQRVGVYSVVHVIPCLRYHQGYEIVYPEHGDLDKVEQELYREIAVTVSG